MIIGCIKEVKDKENRVGLTPFGAKKLRKQGYKVLIQKNAGINAGFSDQEYKKAGATILSTPSAIAKKCDILIKVKEPIKKEYPLLKLLKHKILFTYLHLAAAPKELTLQLLKNKVTAIAYETVKNSTGLPLLRPMSQIAGVLAVQYGAQYLQVKYGGRGTTLGNIDHANPATVVVLGAGNVGMHAALTTAGMGASVIVAQRNDKKRKKNEKKYKTKTNLNFISTKPSALTSALKKADLLIGAVLVAGAKAPKVATQKMVKQMQPGAVIVDVAIDQGGCVFGSKPTSHTNPIYKKDNKIYCCITNMPGQVAPQATQALTNATLPFLLKLANGGTKTLWRKRALLSGLNTYKGNITCEPVAKSLGLMNKFCRIG